MDDEQQVLCYHKDNNMSLPAAGTREMDFPYIIWPYYWLRLPSSQSRQGMPQGMTDHSFYPGYGASGVDNLNDVTKLEDCLSRPAEPTRPKIRYSGCNYGGRPGIVSGPYRRPSVPLLRDAGRPKILVPVGPGRLDPVCPDWLQVFSTGNVPLLGQHGQGHCTRRGFANVVNDMRGYDASGSRDRR